MENFSRSVYPILVKTRVQDRGLTGRLITHYSDVLHMPIEIDQFESGTEDVLEIKEGTQPYTVLAFLAANDGHAFTQSEIHEATDIPQGSVGVVLSRLEDRGLVRHQGRYWAIADDDRLSSYAAQEAASATSVTDDYYGDTEE